MASLDIAEISNLPEQHGGVLQPSQGGSPTGTSILQALPEVQSREEPATQPAAKKPEMSGQPQSEEAGATSVTIADKKVDLATLGLGKAIDSTNPHPWANKSSYQAKIVTMSNTTWIHEGSHYRHYTEFVDNYFALQGSIESTLKVPNQPIDVGVAADASRSTRSTKLVQGKIIYTSTVAFKVLADSPSNPVTNFEEDLRRWIKTEWDAKKRTYDELTDDEIKVNLCEEFLRQLGGVTHFVSSVTLGAVEHTQMKVLAREMKTSVSTSVGAERVGSSKVKASTHKFNKTANDEREKIGRIGEKETVMELAVVRYAFTSVASLITTDIKLMEAVQKAVVNFTDQQLNRESGPYYITSAELMSGKPLYWKMTIEEDRHSGKANFRVKTTTDIDDASSFCIEQDWSKGGAFFFITYHHDTKKTSPSGHPCVMLKRYIHLKFSAPIPSLAPHASVKLKAYAAVAKDSVRKTARFQVVDHVSHHKRGLEISDWLPGKGRVEGSLPCFIRPRLHRHCLAMKRVPTTIVAPTALSAPAEPRVDFHVCKVSHHREGRCHMLLSLIPKEVGTSKDGGITDSLSQSPLVNSK